MPDGQQRLWLFTMLVKDPAKDQQPQQSWTTTTVSSQPQNNTETDSKYADEPYTYKYGTFDLD